MSMTIRTLRSLLLVVGVVAALALGTSVADAQTDDPYIIDDGKDRGPEGNGNSDPEVLDNATGSVADSRSLPFTGGEATTYAIVGAGFVLAGSAFVIASRRRTQAD